MANFTLTSMYRRQRDQAFKDRDEAFDLLARLLSEPDDKRAQDQARLALVSHGPWCMTYGEAEFTRQARIIEADSQWFGMVVEVPTKIKGREFTSSYTVCGIDLSRRKVIVRTKRNKLRYMTVVQCERALGWPSVGRRPGSRDMQV